MQPSPMNANRGYPTFSPVFEDLSSLRLHYPVEVLPAPHGLPDATGLSGPPRLASGEALFALASNRPQQLPTNMHGATTANPNLNNAQGGATMLVQGLPFGTHATLMPFAMPAAPTTHHHTDVADLATGMSALSYTAFKPMQQQGVRQTMFQPAMMNSNNNNNNNNNQPAANRARRRSSEMSGGSQKLRSPLEAETEEVFDPDFKRIYTVPASSIVHRPPERLNITRLVACRNYRADDPEGCTMGRGCKFVHANCDYATLESHSIHVNYVWRNEALCIYPRLPSGVVLKVLPAAQAPTSSNPNSPLTSTHSNTIHSRRASEVLSTAADESEKEEILTMDSSLVLQTRGSQRYADELQRCPLGQIASCSDAPTASCSSGMYSSSAPRGSNSEGEGFEGHGGSISTENTGFGPGKQNERALPPRCCAHFVLDGMCPLGELCDGIHPVYVDPTVQGEFKRASKKRSSNNNNNTNTNNSHSSEVARSHPVSEGNGPNNRRSSGAVRGAHNGHVASPFGDFISPFSATVPQPMTGGVGQPQMQLFAAPTSNSPAQAGSPPLMVPGGGNTANNNNNGNNNNNNNGGNGLFRPVFDVVSQNANQNKILATFPAGAGNTTQLLAVPTSTGETVFYTQQQAGGAVASTLRSNNSPAPPQAQPPLMATVPLMLEIRDDRALGLLSDPQAAGTLLFLPRNSNIATIHSAVYSTAM